MCRTTGATGLVDRQLIRKSGGWCVDLAKGDGEGSIGGRSIPRLVFVGGKSRVLLITFSLLTLLAPRRQFVVGVGETGGGLHHQRRTGLSGELGPGVIIPPTQLG